MNNKVDWGFWSRRLANKEGLEMALAYKVRELSDPYVPFLSGNLAGHVSVNHDDAGAHIIYGEKYGHYQYNGFSKNGNPLHYTTTHHPLAGPNWIEPVKRDAMNKITSFTKEAILHGTGLGS
ncbi:minor capsid protein [Companilactobacillus muriivasis]|uniref:minor capsid protein n=1 Tax=Companilactobacillus muriivasis TaxID=3081444 RepID=UPI0030C72984